MKNGGSYEPPIKFWSKTLYRKTTNYVTLYAFTVNTSF